MPGRRSRNVPAPEGAGSVFCSSASRPSCVQHAGAAGQTSPSRRDAKVSLSRSPRMHQGQSTLPRFPRPSGVFPRFCGGLIAGRTTRPCGPRGCASRFSQQRATEPGPAAAACDPSVRGRARGQAAGGQPPASARGRTRGSALGASRAGPALAGAGAATTGSRCGDCGASWWQEEAGPRNARVRALVAGRRPRSVPFCPFSAPFPRSSPPWTLGHPQAPRRPCPLRSVGEVTAARAPAPPTTRRAPQRPAGPCDGPRGRCPGTRPRCAPSTPVRPPLLGAQCAL